MQAGNAQDIMSGALGSPLDWQLRDGEHVKVRPATRTDAVAERAFIEGLSRESRYYRFLTGGRIAEDLVDAFVATRTALVITAGREGEQRIVANGHFVADDNGVADFAIAVADDWQGKGLGRRLILRLVEMARAAGLTALRGDVLSENRRMLAILRELGFRMRRNPEDNLLHEAALSLPAAASDEPAPAGGATTGSRCVEQGA